MEAVLDFGSWLRTEFWETATLQGCWCLHLPAPPQPHPPAHPTDPLLAELPYWLFLKLPSSSKCTRFYAIHLVTPCSQILRPLMYSGSYKETAAFALCITCAAVGILLSFMVWKSEYFARYLQNKGFPSFFLRKLQFLLSKFQLSLCFRLHISVG